VRTAEEELERQQANRPSFFVRATSSISGAVGGPESRALERHRALTKAAKEETEAWRTQLERVNKELESIGKQRNVAAIQRAMQEAQKQTDESGKDADRLRRDNLEDKGATQEQLAELDRLVAKRKLREQLLALDKEARYAGMTDKQKALQDAADNGATQKDLDRIRQNQRRIDMQTMLAKTLEELKTPEQKLQEETSKLNQLYEEGQLTADQYAQANQKLRDSILGVAAAEQAAMKFGSQADMAERRRYFDALNLSPGTAPPPRPDFNAVQGQQAAVKQAENTELLKQVLTKLNEAGVFNLAFIGGGAG
jgi:myosin heavy subunit